MDPGPKLFKVGAGAETIIYGSTTLVGRYMWIEEITKRKVTGEGKWRWEGDS